MRKMLLIALPASAVAGADFAQSEDRDEVRAVAARFAAAVADSDGGAVERVRVSGRSASRSIGPRRSAVIVMPAMHSAGANRDRSSSRTSHSTKSKHCVRHYNERRTHSALGNRPPIQRVRQVTGLDTTVIGDKGYASRDFQAAMNARQALIVRPRRKDESGFGPPRRARRVSQDTTTLIVAGRCRPRAARPQLSNTRRRV